MSTKQTKQNMSKITIYTNETCPYCKQIKEKLTEKNIEFENKTGENHKDEWQSVVSLTGMPTVPTIKYEDEYFVPGRDFNSPEQLISILENFKSSQYSDSRKTLERLKTLNFHINTAFGRLDQSLKQMEKNYKELFEDEETKTE